eukprot:895440-Rhodomonas_salina.1
MSQGGAKHVTSAARHDRPHKSTPRLCSVHTMPEGQRTPQRVATNAKALKAKQILARPAPKPETPPEDDEEVSEDEGGRWYVYESAEEGEEESAEEEDDDVDANDAPHDDEEDEPQVVDLASNEAEESGEEPSPAVGKRKLVRTVIFEDEDNDVGAAPASGT